ncbi:MAG: translation elongation factor Ts [Chloroflexi bacterium]|nr:translation elongation factor Ts [Chloroflexota bacterium]|tara:strand:- start:20039 stop:20518 length:480 start_codon:yes stop_codon:yes gene_type:complete
MPEIDVVIIKELRELTGAGIMDCKQALEETKGNINEAAEILRKKGIASAAKRASRTAGQGVIESYIHSGNKIGAMIEINCETDFVARTEEFKGLAHDIAMQIAAMNPDNETEDNSLDSLLSQEFIKDPSKTIGELVTEVTAKTGEHIEVKRFIRFAIGD